ncbi:MAG: phosphate signaling complex protein PhoU [Rhodobacteraceae bacterium]|nr:phosphate signaling complex protein PhoU [Paracoccaceae bacterium]
MSIEQRHIDSAFDEDLDRLLGQLMTMGGLVESSIRDSSEALFLKDIELVDQTIRSDARIDAIEEEIQLAAVNLIALRQPRASDLRMVMAAMRISSILERVGDCSKNTAKRTTAILQSPLPGSAFSALERLARATQVLVKDSLDAFIQTDEHKAGDVIRRDHEIDQMHNSIFRQYLALMEQNPKVTTPLMHLLFIAKNFERIGDHATGIAEQSIYLKTGSLPDGERKKDDSTAFLTGPATPAENGIRKD